MEILTHYVRGLDPMPASQVHPVAQAIMTVIGRRSRYYGNRELEPLDLSGAESLRGIALQRANLSGSNLLGANLSGANLSGASLQRANLERADLSRVKLEKANLKEAYLREVNLKRATLRGADLSGANLRRTNIAYAQLEMANGDINTVLPDHVKTPPTSWDVKPDDLE